LRRLRRRTVAVTGTGGAGKTALADFLSDRTGIHYIAPRTSHKAEARDVRAGGWPVRLITVPGQEGPAQNDAVDRLFDKRHPLRPTLHGVIHVVANGYLSLRHDEVEATFVHQGLKTLAEFRKVRLKQERDDLERLCHYIGDCHRRHNGRLRWLIVAVSKADLYLPDIGEVRSAYMDGEFGKRLDSLKAQLGSHKFGWTALPVCARFEPFKYNGDTASSEMSDDVRALYARHFLNALGDHCG